MIQKQQQGYFTQDPRIYELELRYIQLYKAIKNKSQMQVYLGHEVFKFENVNKYEDFEINAAKKMHKKD